MSTSTFSILSLVCFLVALSSNGVSARTPCHICGAAGNQAMHYPNVELSNVGKTCTQISMEVAMNFSPNTQQCTSKQNEWRGRCCTPGQRPSGTTQTPGSLKPQNVPKVNYVGPHPVCNVCRDGDYPYATSMVINFLYIGEGSCAQYYKYGKEGRIQAHMCDPVKFFSYEPCGCGEFNPHFNKNHPLNQQAQQAPGQNNNNNNNNNGNNGSSGSGNSGTGPQQQRVPDAGDSSKACASKIGGQGRGGSAGQAKCGNRRELEGKRGLKGAKKTEEVQHYDSIAVVEDVEPQE